jgi:AcrR family transcriptional regulator
MRLLEATIESLVAVGYARTSTTEIAERAGVSRGAQVYHYPTKAALVTAAVEHLLQRRDQEVRRLFAERLPRAGGPGAAIDLLWKMFEGPTFAAWLEFVVASRTDPELRAAVVRQSEPFVNSIGEALRKHLPQAAWNPVLRKPDFAFALLDGLALARILYLDQDRPTRMFASLREIVEQMQPPRPPSARKTKKGRRAP